MKNEKGRSLILITLRFILFILIVFIAYFCFYVLKEEMNLDTNKFIEPLQAQIDVKPIIPDEKINEEKVEISVKPVVVQKNNNENDSEKFYKSSINGYSKLIYNSLEEQKEDIKTGTKAIELPSSIGSILENEDYEDNMTGIFTIGLNAFAYDNPDIFYIDTSKLVLFYEKDGRGNYNLYIKNNEDENYLMDGINNKNDVEEKILEVENIADSIIEEVNNLSTDYEKILYIHDWLVSNIEYDQTLSRPNKNNIYGALVEKQATCGGYAFAFKYLLDKCNIESIVVLGEAISEDETENHAWNYIYLNDKWFGIDSTWDDPVIVGQESVENNLRYDYFLKGKNVFDTDHVPFTTFYGTNVNLNYPTLSINNYSF